MFYIFILKSVSFILIANVFEQMLALIYNYYIWVIVKLFLALHA